ncbi:hypothetical protein BC940DRAFT_233842 [Gongronella butleri]|nr:hypothetical protein BC940DRAFT_233842 [Gongronella butleri]
MPGTAIVTGANAGVGYGLIQHLLQRDPDMGIIMACRNPTRANQAKQGLLAEFPGATIHIELQHCHHLFCNAGILSSTGINWSLTAYLVFTDPIGLMERADATKQAVGEMNKDGMGKVFAANVFGHYVMMRELESLLASSGDGRVIWTSSITASPSSFDIDDWQGIKCLEPYESSKWACDLLAAVSTERFKTQNMPITSFTTSPGVVATSIADLPGWIKALRMRFIGVTSQNITGYCGAFADAYVAFAPLLLLNATIRYLALTDRWGRSFIGEQPLPVDMDIATQLNDKCEKIYQAHKSLNNKESLE